jgi:hypothetical protein
VHRQAEGRGALGELEVFDDHVAHRGVAAHAAYAARVMSRHWPLAILSTGRRAWLTRSPPP